MEEINKVNKYFLGFKINTNYLKTYQEVSVDNIPSSKEIYRVTDLPFAISIKDDKLVKEVEQDPRTTRAGKLLFTNNRYEPILS